MNSQPEGCGYGFWESIDFSGLVKPWLVPSGIVIAIVMPLDSLITDYGWRFIIHSHFIERRAIR